MDTKENPMTKVLISNELRIVLQLMSVIAVVANLWLFSQLAPIVQSIALQEQRIKSLEMVSNSDTTIANSIRISVLEQQYARIEEKLDRVLQN